MTAGRSRRRSPPSTRSGGKARAAHADGLGERRACRPARSPRSAKNRAAAVTMASRPSAGRSAARAHRRPSLALGPRFALAVPMVRSRARTYRRSRLRILPWPSTDSWAARAPPSAAFKTASRSGRERDHGVRNGHGARPRDRERGDGLGPVRSGCPTRPRARASGCVVPAPLDLLGDTFMPPVLIMSVRRWWKDSCPRRRTRTMSPCAASPSRGRAGCSLGVAVGSPARHRRRTGGSARPARRRRRPRRRRAPPWLTVADPRGVAAAADVRRARAKPARPCPAATARTAPSRCPTARPARPRRPGLDRRGRHLTPVGHAAAAPLRPSPVRTRGGARPVRGRTWASGRGR